MLKLTQVVRASEQTGSFGTARTGTRIIYIARAHITAVYDGRVFVQGAHFEITETAEQVLALM
jgi:hypothetical protein